MREATRPLDPQLGKQQTAAVPCVKSFQYTDVPVYPRVYVYCSTRSPHYISATCGTDVMQWLQGGGLGGSPDCSGWRPLAMRAGTREKCTVTRMTLSLYTAHTCLALHSDKSVRCTVTSSAVAQAAATHNFAQQQSWQDAEVAERKAGRLSLLLQVGEPA